MRLTGARKTQLWCERSVEATRSAEKGVVVAASARACARPTGLVWCNNYTKAFPVSGQAHKPNRGTQEEDKKRTGGRGESARIASACTPEAGPRWSIVSAGLCENPCEREKLGKHQVPPPPTTKATREVGRHGGHGGIGGRRDCALRGHLQGFAAHRSLANEGNYGQLLDPKVAFEPLRSCFLRQMARVLVVVPVDLGASC